MESMIVLSVGKRRIATKGYAHENDEHGLFLVERRGDALVFFWNRAVSDFEPGATAFEELLEALGADLLQKHLDPHGVLVSEVPPDSLADSYDAIVAQCTDLRHAWIACQAAVLRRVDRALTRDEIPLPDVPHSRRVELYLLSPARALRELSLDAAPLRVVALDRTTTLTLREVSAFYLPRLRALGFTPKRRIWSDGSAEELVARQGTQQVLVRAELLEGKTFVRIAWITLP